MLIVNSKVCCSGEESGVFVVNGVAWRGAAYSPKIWFANGGGVSVKVCGGVVRKGVDPSIVVTRRLLTGVTTVVGPSYYGVLVETVIDGCGEVVVVMSGSNDIMDLTGLPGVLLASPVPSVVIFNVDDVWLPVACGHTPDGTK
ncbi:unnamed protein product [Lactuca virosa]|uniref:Uncharacterized protein n=1 Tax=Lactuca virosa TaxID=75947 RepID=A0AAU9LQ44_9ASTR|nr:unnamed protein product [Lactuca virosa]